MNYRKPSKNYDLFSALSKKRDQETKEVGILKLNKIIDWEGFRGLMEEIAGYSSKDNKKGGRPPFAEKRILFSHEIFMKPRKS